MNEEMRTVLDQMMGHTEVGDGERVVWSFDELAQTIAPSHEMNWLRWDQPYTYADWRDTMREALEHRYDNWYNNLWNEKKYLLGLTAEAEDNGDGTWTLTAETYGRIDSDYVVWYRIGDDITKGPNNAFYSGAEGKTFKSRNITVISNIITSPDDRAESGIIPAGKKYLRTLALQNGGLVIPTSDTETGTEETADVLAEAESAPVQRVSRTAALSDAEWIMMAAGIVLLSAVMIVLAASKNKGGRANAAR